MSALRSNRSIARTLGVALLLGALLASLALVAARDSAPGGTATAAEKARKPLKRPIVAVSNNWDGTVDIIDARTYKRLKRVNVVPDRAERMAEISLNPVDLAFFLAIRNQIGEGHDQLADDAFTSPSGRRLYVSRPSFADVVAISLKTGRIIWRTKVAGNRSDHMAISHNGKRLLVSASTGNVVHAIDTRNGRKVGEFPSGDSPHENNYSADGKRIFHASIGRVYTPTDMGGTDTTKGGEFFQIVNARTYKVIKRLNMGDELARAGYPDMSAAVRPMTLSPNERFVYFQVSFFFGFIEYDLKKFRVRRVINLPRTHSIGVPREQFVLDSAHHGIAMNGNGRKICVAGTMDDYAAVVWRRSGTYKIIQFKEEARPYWVTPSADGRSCLISLAGLDRVAVIDYRTGRKIKSFRVGDHPQRMRTGFIRRAFVR